MLIQTFISRIWRHASICFQVCGKSHGASSIHAQASHYSGGLHVMVVLVVAWRWCSDIYGGYSFM